MTREEALREMRAGAKVRHEFFTSEEYLLMDRYDRITTEDGYEFAEEFHSRDWFATGWKVVLNKVVILGNDLRMILIDDYIEETVYEPRPLRKIYARDFKGWLQSRLLAQKLAVRLSAHEGVYSRWNQSRQGGRPFGKTLQGRRVPRKG